MEAVLKIKSRMCAFGMHDSDNQAGGLVNKDTGFMTNAIEIAAELANRVVVLKDM